MAFRPIFYIAETSRIYNTSVIYSRHFTLIQSIEQEFNTSDNDIDWLYISLDSTAESCATHYLYILTHFEETFHWYARLQNICSQRIDLIFSTYSDFTTKMVNEQQTLRRISIQTHGYNLQNHHQNRMRQFSKFWGPWFLPRTMTSKRIW